MSKEVRACVVADAVAGAVSTPVTPVRVGADSTLALSGDVMFVKPDPKPKPKPVPGFTPVTAFTGTADTNVIAAAAVKATAVESFRIPGTVGAS